MQQARNLEEVINRTLDLPVLPATTQRVLGMMADPDVSIEKIKKIISTDPGLTTKIMKVANSAFYGSYRNIQNPTQAILRLGLNSVRNIVVATSMKNVYKRFGLTEKLIWEQMIGAAVAASIIARDTRRSDPEDAFIGGLLHDVGKVVLNNEFPEKFALMMQSVYNEMVPYDVAEKEHFDFSQRDVGAYIVKKWGFPESLETLIRGFNGKETSSRDENIQNLVNTIALADIMCQKFGMGWRKPGGDEISYGGLPESLGLEKKGLEALDEKVRLAFAENADLY
ncbi:MAG: HDOD domain-containing protein [Deltaproteobacteria bacterium]|nr:HDOD domain-containing protein [Deltaproteobacteria bacterium]MCL4872476.1 HDOD domain-containing protein [bacterium]